MRLPKSLARYGTPEFEESLVGELEELELRRGALPLAVGCTNGGAPKPHSVTIRLEHCTGDETIVRAKVNVSFDESANSGCSNLPRSYPQFMDCQVCIDRATAEATVEVIERWEGEEI